nr:hypothetical protein [Tanacetum cinerariifolium]
MPQQPPFKKPDVSRSYTIRANERKAYAGNLPYSNKYAQVEAIKDEKFIIEDLYGMIKKLGSVLMEHCASIGEVGYVVE